jgi:uncharacterized membrane protein YdjX (TVP38/TMEM64 family)
MTPRIILRGLLLIGTLVLIAYLIEATKLGEMVDQTWMDRHVRGRGLAGDILFLAVGSVFTAVGMPRQFIAFLAGYGFGFLQGTVLGAIAALLGCVTAFYYARWFGRALVAGRYAAKVARLDEFLARSPFMMTLLIRLLPVGSNLVTNLAAGVTRIDAGRFIAGTALGYLPQTAVFALVGSGIRVDPALRIGLGTLLFVASALLGVHLYRRMNRGKVVGEIEV